jgi:hypothetical protein
MGGHSWVGGEQPMMMHPSGRGKESQSEVQVWEVKRRGLCRERHGVYFTPEGRSWPLKMGPIRCPETSVKNYHSTLCYTPEERRSQR